MPFCNMLGMTQKYFGQLPEFPKKTAEVYMAKYETGARTTEADLAESLAGVLGGACHWLCLCWTLIPTLV